MRQKSNSTPARRPRRLVRNIRRATRKHHAAEEKIRIVLDGLRGETSYRRALPARRHRREHVLLLVEGVPGGRQAPARRRHGAGPRRPMRKLSGLSRRCHFLTGIGRAGMSALANSLEPDDTSNPSLLSYI